MFIVDKTQLLWTKKFRRELLRFLICRISVKVDIVKFWSKYLWICMDWYKYWIHWYFDFRFYELCRFWILVFDFTGNLFLEIFHTNHDHVYNKIPGSLVLVPMTGKEGPRDWKGRSPWLDRKCRCPRDWKGSADDPRDWRGVPMVPVTGNEVPMVPVAGKEGPRDWIGSADVLVTGKEVPMIPVTGGECRWSPWLERKCRWSPWLERKCRWSPWLERKCRCPRDWKGTADVLVTGKEVPMVPVTGKEVPMVPVTGKEVPISSWLERKCRWSPWLERKCRCGAGRCNICMLRGSRSFEYEVPILWKWFLLEAGKFS